MRIQSYLAWAMLFTEACALPQGNIPDELKSLEYSAELHEKMTGIFQQCHAMSLIVGEQGLGGSDAEFSSLPEEEKKALAAIQGKIGVDFIGLRELAGSKEQLFWNWAEYLRRNPISDREVLQARCAAEILAALAIPQKVGLPATAKLISSSDVWIQRIGNLALLSIRYPNDYGDYVHKEFLIVLRTLKEEGRDPSEPLIHYMIVRSPKESLRALSEVYFSDDPEMRKMVKLTEIMMKDFEWKERRSGLGTLDEEKDIAPIVDQLLRLCESNVWWIRLYVSCVLIALPELHDRKLVETLRSDSHAMVRDAVEMIDEKEPQIFW